MIALKKGIKIAIVRHVESTEKGNFELKFAINTNI